MRFTSFCSTNKAKLLNLLQYNVYEFQEDIFTQNVKN